MCTRLAKHHASRTLGIQRSTSSKGFIRSNVTAVRSCVPRRIRVNVAGIITGFLDLAHGGTTTAKSAAKVGAGATTADDVQGERGNECEQAEPEEGSRSLSVTAVLGGVGGAVGHLVGDGICLRSVSARTRFKSNATRTYPVRTAMHMEVRGKRNGGAEAEEHAQSVKCDVHNWDAELLDEGGGQEVEQGDEPPDAHKEGVVDNGGYAVVCASHIAAHQASHEDGAEQLVLLVKAS